MDKTSYAIGLSFGQHLAQSGIKGLDYAAFAKGVETICEGLAPEIEFSEAQELLNAYFGKMEEAKAAAGAGVKAEGEAFLAENAKRAEVKTTASGLQYEVIVEGNGAKPTAASTVEVHYEGTLIDGTVFDSSIKRGETIEFPLNGVIKGWTEGLQLMATGSKYRLYIPYNLAYGEQGAGQMIAPYAALIFDVELISIK